MKRPQHEAPPERLQKVMAAAGLGSRRAIEAHIAAGDIQVNGEPARVGQTVATGDSLAQILR